MANINTVSSRAIACLAAIASPAIELFRHRFLHALREGKHISPKKPADLLSWKNLGKADWKATLTANETVVNSPDFAK